MVSISLSGSDRIEKSVCASKDVMNLVALTCVGSPSDLGGVRVGRCREGGGNRVWNCGNRTLQEAAAIAIIGTNAPMMRVANMVNKIDEQTYTRYILMQGFAIRFPPASSD
jgi:hypothetical protein